MILGPVFHAELVATSRRRRSYLARLAYGLALLAMVGWAYEETVLGWAAQVSTPPPATTRLRELSATVFAAFLLAQVGAVVVLTPALVAGAIAEERQRKTLHYLLASRLTGSEIVVGKLAARMLQVVALVLAGLPILSLLTLLGGLDPPLVVAAFAATLTTAFALAGLAILVSSRARRARDAIAATYVLAGLWLGGLPALRASLGPTSSWFSDLVRSLRWIDPFQIVDLIDPRPGLLADLARMMGLQVGLGLAFAALAAWRLRPSSAHSGPSRSRGRGFRLLARPAVGDDPMAWKERHVARFGPALRAVGGLATVGAAFAFGRTLIGLGRPALAELANHGYGDGPAVVHSARDGLQQALALAGSAAGTAWIVGIAATTAAGIPSEREGDTWMGLLGTTLTGGEILRGKALGALWRWRFVGGAAAGLWTFGLLAGAIHPLGYALTLALFATYTAFALALGSFVGLRARGAARAIAATMGLLFVLDGGYLMCLFPLAGRLDDLWVAAPVMPYVLGIAPARYATVQALFGTYPAAHIYLYMKVDAIVARVLTCGVSLVGYGVAAAALGVAAVDGFDRAADRPRRPPGWAPMPDESDT